MSKWRTVATAIALVAMVFAWACGDGTVKKKRDPDPIPEPACGDGRIDEGETCDGSDFGGNTCNTLGFDLGSLSCSAQCQLVTTQCVKLCGDGQVGPGEECDSEVGPLACGDWGYKSCSDTCKVDALHCRTTAFDALAPVLQSSGGPSVLTDLSPQGFGDLVTAVPGFGRLQTHDYDLTTGFTEDRKIQNMVHTPALPIAADMDGDGHVDLASINTDGSVDRYRFVPGAGFQTRALLSPAPVADGGLGTCAAAQWVGAGKLDADAADDLVALGCLGTTSTTTFNALIILPGGTDPASPRQVEPGTALSAATLTDSDGDGLMDIVAATADGKVLILKAPDFAVGAPIDLPGQASLVAAGDLDADGDADVVVQSAANILVLENTGSGFAQRRSEAATASSLLVADLDLDGVVDFAWMEAEKVEVRRSLGQFTFTAWPVTTGTGTPLSFSHGDIDNDGDPDLAVTVSTSGAATTTFILRNRVR